MQDDNDFFRSDAFLDVLRDVFYPGGRAQVVECEGHRFRLLVHRGGAVSGFWPFPFPSEEVFADGVARRVPQVLDYVHAELSVGVAAPPGMQAAPLVRWEQFPSFEAFEAWAQESPRNAQVSATRRNERRIARDLGRCEYVPEDVSDEAFDTILRWKSEQYLRSGFPERFTGRRRGIYEEMRRRGLLTVSSLRADGRIIAGHIGNRWRGRLLYRLPSYDFELARYSPGRVHLHHMLRDSFERGDTVFDFLGGAEAYKLQYATHIRWMRDLGREPLRQRIPRVARWRASQVARRSPALYRRLQQIEQRVRSLRS